MIRANFTELFLFTLYSLCHKKTIQMKPTILQSLVHLHPHVLDSIAQIVARASLVLGKSISISLAASNAIRKSFSKCLT